MAKGPKRSARAYPGKNSPSQWPLVFTVLLALSIVLIVLLSLGIFSLPISSDPSEERELMEREVVKTPHETRKKVTRSDGLGARGDQWTEVLSWEPRAFIYHNFLSKEECEYLIQLAKPHMEKSMVVDSDTGKSKDSRVRTSSGTFLKRGQDKMIRAIEQRIADYTFIPVEHGEGLQILHYEIGQKYEPHFDYFLDEYNTQNGGQRMATLLMYLSDVEEGGETIFPSVPAANASLRADYGQLSECGKTGLAVRPSMGDALLFWSMKPDASLDPLSLHGGCPVVKGNKWSSTKWMRAHEFKTD
ncbi:putative prolyl 4-hydroxylase 3 [Wolffia australiana]